MFLKQPSIAVCSLLCSICMKVGESLSVFALNLTLSERKRNGKLVPPSCSPSRMSSPVTLESLVLSARRTGPLNHYWWGKKFTFTSCRCSAAADKTPEVKLAWPLRPVAVWCSYPESCFLMACLNRYPCLSGAVLSYLTGKIQSETSQAGMQCCHSHFEMKAGELQMYRCAVLHMLWQYSDCVTQL